MQKRQHCQKDLRLGKSNYVNFFYRPQLLTQSEPQQTVTKHVLGILQCYHKLNRLLKNCILEKMFQETNVSEKNISMLIR